MCFFNVSGMGQIGSRGGYPAEHRQMTTGEHRLWNLKLQADMISRAALKALKSQHAQQRSVDYERQPQELQAALKAQREAEVVNNCQAHEAPTTPSERGDGNNATSAQPACLASAIGAPVTLHPRVQQRRAIPPLLLSPEVPPSGNVDSTNNEGDQGDADRRQPASVETEAAQVPREVDQKKQPK